MEQNIEGKETPTQHTIDNDWNGEMNQTLEQALQSEQVQKSFQQLHKFNALTGHNQSKEENYRQ